MEKFLASFPSVKRQFADAKPTRPFTHSPKISCKTAQASGKNWTMLPSAAAFIDPLFSTGIPLTLLGIERLGQILERHWEKPTLEENLNDYAKTTLAEADATADFLGGCYAAMPNFDAFVNLSQFYFVAASYTEMARRLEKPHLTQGFLAWKHPQFGPATRRQSANARAGKSIDADDAECLNVAGLYDETKCGWYGLDWEDVIENAQKLDTTPAQMREILRDAPWAQGAPDLDKSALALIK